MADNTTLNAGTGGDVIGSDDIAGVKYQRVKLIHGADGVNAGDVASGNPLPVSGAFFQATQPVSIASMPTTPVTGTFWQATQPVSFTWQGLTDAQLRASAVPVSLTSTTITGTVATTQSGNWSARTQDSAGNGIGSIADGAGLTALATAMGATNFVVSAANSSTVQLANGATFTGTIETIFNQQAISVLLTSDQAGTLTLNQYIDIGGTRRISQWTFSVAANVPFSRCFVGNGNFFNLTFQNTGGSTTTTLNINTAYGTLPAASNLGNMPVAINEVNGAALALGQGTMAASLPVVLASNQSVISVVENATVITGQASQTATINNIIDAVAGANGTDVSNARTAVVQVTSTGTGGTFIFEQSNDNVNWVALPVFNAALVTGVPITAAITATNSSVVYTFPIRCRFIRLRIATTITGGSIQAFSRISTEPWTAAAQLVASNTAANLNATVSGTVTANIGTGSLAAGTNAIGDVGLQVRANATGAASIHHIVSAATTNVAQIKATAGRVLGYCLSNTTASWRYVKLHNVASATAGAGVVQTIGIPPNGKAECHIAQGIGFATAISRSIVTGSADADATATAVGDVVGDIFFA